ncbi:hypothetical protein CA54_14460 [Symmachiella macrocystis]|uniref:LarA-like N-terminal domain-containing protein n=1 Tax=Symmachiella macrocystis TaxID=2527985 RepID=A0A5C6BLI8_9PLAN|nr:lactate racemase domain-containing protein [Symmachiella macrocystis]TWU12622.1 hypothetical protein CA54_14460 [Symmachiella macrocystis]
MSEIHVELPWGAWYRDELHRLQLPGHWEVDVLAPAGGPACTPQDIQAAITAPIDSPPLTELAAGKTSACIVIDDMSRPTRTAMILPPLLEQLRQAGIADSAVSIVMATGSHGNVPAEDIAKKVGPEIAATYRVECHDCRGDLASTGIAYGDRELRVNRTFYEAELKLGISSILPHSFAGFSGGAKLVLPGLTDVEATARSHKFVQLGLRGGADPDRNKFRSEAEQLARTLGMEFIVCVVSNQQRDPSHVFAGNIVAAHRAACHAASGVFSTELRRDYDCLILNAYPKDNDLIQAENVFIALKTAKSPTVGDDGVIVITTAASEGVGQHGLFEPGGLSYRAPQPKRFLKNRELWLYAPTVTTQNARALYWEGYPVFQRPEELTAALDQRFPQPTRCGVFPCAPMQQVSDARGAVMGVAV